MTEQHTNVRLSAASVSDRGLSEKRPLNEDSMLADSERRIFVVADGVGGAQAGEVASQTAVEVLGEAFLHHKDGDDIEDLMEIAIQRANSSIHQMSREHPKLSMMATTVVALHLDGRRATIGHVGDSRLYRFSPDGKIHRETNDHSVVEEEVRAGRMTAQQAATHPSRNVISRALGADSSVEVDMKTAEVEDGTIFVLCSDGITRHIPDEELRAMLGANSDLDAVCAELKKRCYERGAEDNLTAVLVRVGETASNTVSTADADDWDAERTIIAERGATASASSPDQVNASLLNRPFESIGAQSPSGVAAEATQNMNHTRAASDSTAAPRKSGGGGKILLILLLLLAASAGAFFGGMMFERRTLAPMNAAEVGVQPQPTAAAVPTESAEASYMRRLREVDRSPAAAAERMTLEMSGQPLTSPNPDFLYRYGRALLLSGKSAEAVEAFRKSIEQIEREPMTPENQQLKIEARMAGATAALMANNSEAARGAAQALDVDIRGRDEGAAAVAPTSSPLLLPSQSAPAP